ncbi:hypothetical protein TNCV_4523961 [Trichonephila clavipes]|nr:hypothetical protein TNCV_4523961 [Trichonephila clavipes]
MPMRRHDVRLTRLRIGHTCFMHRHLLLGENAPECPSCKDPCGEGYAAEELRASSVTASRNALPKAVPEDEELGCGWLGGAGTHSYREILLGFGLGPCPAARYGGFPGV